MTKLLLCLLLALGLTATLAMVAPTAEKANREPNIVHNVFFSLKDNSAQAKKKLVDACKKYLTKHSGEVYFSAGVVADFDRPVNDRDWDVGLHIVFKDKASHDKYQDDPRHKQFIEENKDNWKKVRVFDTVVD
jgi:hypothetical protein